MVKGEGGKREKVSIEKNKIKRYGKSSRIYWSNWEFVGEEWIFECFGIFFIELCGNGIRICKKVVFFYCFVWVVCIDGEVEWSIFCERCIFRDGKVDVDVCVFSESNSGWFVDELLGIKLVFKDGRKVVYFLNEILFSGSDVCKVIFFW